MLLDNIKTSLEKLFDIETGHGWSSDGYKKIIQL